MTDTSTIENVLVPEALEVIPECIRSPFNSPEQQNDPIMYTAIASFEVDCNVDEFENYVTLI